MSLYIYDDDKNSRAMIEAHLVRAELADACVVQAWGGEIPSDASANLWVGSCAPDGVTAAVTETDIFPRPVRIGRLLDRAMHYIKNADKKDDLRVIGGHFVLEGHNFFLLDQNNGNKLHLTEKEHRILQLLSDYIGDVVSKSRLLDEVWGYNSQIDTHTLETHIYRLRQKIEDDPSTPSILMTDDNGGYYLG